MLYSPIFLFDENQLAITVSYHFGKKTGYFFPGIQLFSVGGMINIIALINCIGKFI
jgi:hypothetical protein